MLDDILERHGRKDEVGCVDGVAVAEALIAKALEYINFYSGGDVAASRQMLAVLVCAVAREAIQTDGRFERYELPLNAEGRRLDLKSMLQRLDVHGENMRAKVYNLLERARRIGFVERPAPPKKARRS